MVVHIEYRTRAMELPLFRKKYQDREKFIACCRECPHYGELWSCPPLPFDADTFLASYAWANLLCAQIRLDEETIRAADTEEKIKATGWEIVSKAKLDIEERMKILETRMPGSRSLSSGAAGFAKPVHGKKTCPAAGRRKCAIRWTLSGSTSPQSRRTYSI